MHADPHNSCGYTWPEDYDDELPVLDNQYCCYRDALTDTDRCAWHADPEETDQKTVHALRESRVDPETRELTSPHGELLGGAVLKNLQLKDRISFNNVALQGADLTDANLNYADLTDADLRGTNLINANLNYADLSNTKITRPITDLTGANLKYADLSNAKISSISKPDMTPLADAMLRQESATHTTERRDLPASVATLIGAATAYLFAKNETKERYVELAQHWEKALIYAGLACFVSGGIMVFLQSYSIIGGGLLFDISVVITIIGALITGVGVGSRRFSGDPNKKLPKEQTEINEFPEKDEFDKNEGSSR